MPASTLFELTKQVWKNYAAKIKTGVCVSGNDKQGTKPTYIEFRKLSGEYTKRQACAVVKRDTVKLTYWLVGPGWAWVGRAGLGGGLCVWNG